MKQLGAEAFAFVNVARFAVPVRIGLALSTVPWVQSNIIDRFSSRSEGVAPEQSPFAAPAASTSSSANINVTPDVFFPPQFLFFTQFYAVIIGSLAPFVLVAILSSGWLER